MTPFRSHHYHQAVLCYLICYLIAVFGVLLPCSRQCSSPTSSTPASPLCFEATSMAPSEPQTTTLYLGYGRQASQSLESFFLAAPISTVYTDLTGSSNLWKEQMTLRCPCSEYLGVGRLQGYRWIINGASWHLHMYIPRDHVLGVSVGR